MIDAVPAAPTTEEISIVSIAEYAKQVPLKSTVSNGST